MGRDVRTLRNMMQIGMHTGQNWFEIAFLAILVAILIVTTNVRGAFLIGGIDALAARLGTSHDFYSTLKNNHFQRGKNWILVQLFHLLV